MAHHQSAKKRIRRDKTRQLINHSRMNRIRSFTKKFLAVLADGNADKTADALRKAQSEIARGVTKGVLSRNTASRKISRLMSRVKSS